MEEAKIETGQKILIVEDELPLAEALTEALKEAGYQVSARYNGQEGLESAVSEHPDLILLDVLMPKMDGLTMLKELRKQQQPPKSRVIIFTNINQSEEIANAIAEGADGYVIKSDTSLAEIVKKVSKMLAALKEEQ